MPAYYEDDVGPLDIPEHRLERISEDDQTPDEGNGTANLRPISEEHVAPHVTFSQPQRSSGAESITSHGPFGDSEVASTSSQSDHDLSKSHQQSSVWTTLTAASEKLATVEVTEPQAEPESINEKSGASKRKSVSTKLPT